MGASTCLCVVLSTNARCVSLQQLWEGGIDVTATASAALAAAGKALNSFTYVERADVMYRAAASAVTLFNDTSAVYNATLANFHTLQNSTSVYDDLAWSARAAFHTV